MSDNKLRIGIIGTGGIAGAHMRSYLQLDNAEVVAGCDIIPGKAKALHTSPKRLSTLWQGMPGVSGESGSGLVCSAQPT